MGDVANRGIHVRIVDGLADHASAPSDKLLRQVSNNARGADGFEIPERTRLVPDRGLRRPTMTAGFAKGQSPSTHAPAPSRGRRFPIAPVLIFAAGILLLTAGVMRRRSIERGTIADGAVDPSRASTPNQPSSFDRPDDGAVAVTSPANAIPTPADLDRLNTALSDRIRSQIKSAVDRPDDAAAIGRLGLLYEAHGFRDLARACYERADRQAPFPPRWKYLWAVLAYKEGDRASAEKALRLVVSGAPDYAAAQQRLGRLLLDRGDFDGASACFHRVVELRTSEAPGYLELARLSLAMSRFDQAVDSLQTALRIDPENAEASYLMGQAYRVLGRSREAADAFARGRGSRESLVRDPWREALARFRTTAAADHERALMLMDRGRLSESISLLEDVVRRLPSNIDALNNLAIAYLRAHRLNDARATLKRAKALNPMHFATQVNLSNVLLAKGDDAGALSAAREAVRLAPDSGRAALAEATALARLGRLDDAAKAYEKAVSLDARNPEAFIGLGEVFVRQRRWGDAAPPLEKAVALDPKAALSRYNLGIVYAQLGRMPEAIASLRAAVTLDPTHERARKALARCEALVTGD